MNLEALFGLRAFTRAQARAAGVTHAQWQKLVSDGRLTKFRHGVYAVRPASGDRAAHAQSVSAALAGRSRHFACSASAVALLDLPNPYFRRGSRVPVTVAGPKSDPGNGVRRSTLAPIPTPWGPATDLLDTAAAIAAELPLPQALMITDAVARRVAGTKDRFELASEQCRTEVRRRLTRGCDLPALRYANPAAESPAESFYRGHMLLGGHQDPACGLPLRGASGAQYFADILVGPLIIEVDGRAKYRDLQVLIDEKNREDDLRAAGFRFLRCFVEDLFADPEREMRSLDDRMGQHRRLALPA